jgi:hypothetical protein
MLAAAAQLNQVTQLQLNNIYISRRSISTNSSSSSILESMAQAIAAMPDLRCLGLSLSSAFAPYSLPCRAPSALLGQISTKAQITCFIEKKHLRHVWQHGFSDPSAAPHPR